MINIWDIIITAAVIASVTAAVVKIIKNKKSGRCNCGCCDGTGCKKKKT